MDRTRPPEVPVEPAWRKMKCPACGEANTARIMYGLPSFDQELGESLSTGEVVLGGCVLSPDNPKWHCNLCHHEWGQP